LHTTQGELDVVDNTDDLKGRLKEAAGDLTDDDDLKREGQVDQGKGKVKDFVDRVGDKLK
jgi:uncharacterized protein YjbJ (UPF0337 family)